MINDKYFTTEIMEQDRRDLFSILGLDGLAYLYVELVGDVLTRVDCCEGLVAKPLLHITSRALFDDYQQKSNFPVIERHVSTVGGPVPAGDSPKSLWASFFPYPFCEISLLFEITQNVQLRVRPVSFEAEVGQLNQALVSLEKRMAPFEVGLIVINGQSGGMTLLAHFVRGKRVRIGLPHEIENYLATFRGANPTVSDLESYFGTSVSFVQIDIPPTNGPTQILGGLITAINSAATTVLHSLRTPNDSPIAAQLEL